MTTKPADDRQTASTRGSGLMPAPDRRRSPRRQFREPVCVELRGVQGDGEWRTEGVLLNLSPDGLACRLHERDGESILMGRQLRVAFRPRPSEEVLCLTGRVTNIIRGGTVGQIVVGLALVADADQEQLRRRLTAIVNSRTSEGR